MTCILVPVHIASWIFICHLCEPPLSPHSFSNGCSCRIPRNWFFLAFRHLCFVLCPCLFCILIVVRNISIQYLTCIWVKELGKRINGCYTQLLRCMDIMLARSPDKQKCVWQYSFPVNLAQEASATVCWPLLVHIRPVCLSS